MSNGPIEPSADMREFAKHLRQMFVALKLEGFTEQQAMSVIGTTLAASFGKGDGA